MQTKSILKIVTSLLLTTFMLSLFASLPVFAPVNLGNFPRMDEIYYKAVWPEATAMVSARAGELDMMAGMIDPDNVEELRDDYSWSVSANPGFHMCYVGINCRDTPVNDPPYLWYNAPYGNRTPSFPLYPLNLTDFRLALNYLVGCQKDTWIATLYRFINVRIDTNVPPANVFYFNTDIPPVDYDVDEAYTLLTDMGFDNSSGYWITPKGSEMRPMYLLTPNSAPPTVALGGYVVSSWNDFFGPASTTTGYHEGQADEGYYFCNYPVSVTTEVVAAWINRDFDFYLLCWGLGRDPDYLYVFFHPDYDFWDGYNSPGLITADGEFENKLFAINYWEFPNGTVVPDLATMRDMVWDVQWDLYYYVPYIPMYSRAYHNLFTPGVKSWIDSLGYGSNTFWTMNFHYWYNTGTGLPDLSKNSTVWANPGEHFKFHPGTYTWVYEANIVNMVLDGGLAINPFTHADVMWSVKNYAFRRFNGTIPGHGGWCDGTQVNITIRGGQRFHDGQLADTTDAKFSWECAAEHLPRNYYGVGSDYCNSTILSGTQIRLWFNGTGLWKVYEYLGAMFAFPPQIYSVFTGDTTGFTNFQPWLVDYTTHTGNPKPPEYPWLTCLIGTGPWVYHEWDLGSNVVHLVAFRGPTATYFAGNFKREDINMDAIVDVTDISLAIADFGATPGHPRWSYGQSDTSADFLVDITDIAGVISRYATITLPP